MFSSDRLRGIEAREGVSDEGIFMLGIKKNISGRRRPYKKSEKGLDEG